MKFHLVCVHPFGKYGKGRMITDAAEVEKLLKDREHHFAKIPAPDSAPDPVKS